MATLRGVELSAHSATELESELRRIPGVLSARVVIDDTGSIQELHIVADQTKAAKQVARDASTLAIAQFGVDVDHRAVSVVQLSSGAGPPAPATVHWHRVGPSETEHPVDPRSAGRVVLKSVTTGHSGSCFRAEVVLSSSGRQLRGDAEGQDSLAHRQRIVARAGLNSLAEIQPDLRQADVDVTILRAGEQAVSVASVLVVVGDGNEVLMGSANANESGPDVATVRAVLDATNRRAVSRNGSTVDGLG